MSTPSGSLAARTDAASDIAAAVRSGERSAREVLDAHLRDRLVIDLLPAEHAAAWTPALPVDRHCSCHPETTVARPPPFRISTKPPGAWMLNTIIGIPFSRARAIAAVSMTLSSRPIASA